MFKHKNTLISIAVAMMLTACGGNSDDTDNKPSPNTPPKTEIPGKTDPKPDDSNNETVAATEDAKLQSTITLLDANVLYDKNGSFGLPFSSVATTEKRPTPGEGDAAGYGAYYAVGDNPAPIAAPVKGFGYRFAKMAAGEEQSNDKGRLVFELKDQNVAGIANKETLQIQVDGVTSNVNANGAVSVKINDTATVYVYAATGIDGEVVSISFPAKDLVLAKETPYSAVGSTEVLATDFIFDVDAVMVAALKNSKNAVETNVLEKVKTFGGLEIPMEMTLAISNINLALSPTTTDALLAIDEIGATGSKVNSLKNSAGFKTYIQLPEPVVAGA